ncbi:unnamed protein product [Aspergillus oryzae]|nr:unnamed protein product [Aspergillus oryzae]GMF85259.1 unnamed protein product [Aspergillus oryzae]GMG04400.1 unnamed protein product [Aspergillus oryzae]
MELILSLDCWGQLQGPAIAVNIKKTNNNPSIGDSYHDSDKIPLPFENYGDLRVIPWKVSDTIGSGDDVTPLPGKPAKMQHQTSYRRVAVDGVHVVYN